MIKLVLCDIGNVLMLADHRRTIESFEIQGVPPKKAKAYFSRPDYASLGKGQIDWQEYCDNLKKEWEFALDNSEILHNHSSHIYAIDRGMKYLLCRLSDRIPFAFITNTCFPEWQRYRQLEPLFESVWAAWRSDIFGNHKADEGVFSRIVSDWVPEKLGIKVLPEEILFIDDSRANCEAAVKETGMYAFQYIEREPWLLEKEFITRGLL